MQHHHQYTQINLKIKKQRYSFSIVLIFITFILFPTISIAQKIEGSVRYLMVHNWTKQIAAIDYLSKQAVDRLTYVYGNRAEYKTFSTLFLSPTQSKYTDSEEKAERDDNNYSWRKNEYTITRNYEKKTIRDVIDMLDKTYIIEDSLQVPKWKILNEMKEIAGHICMNAYWNDTLKKQKVTGWYALDIPNSGGPERFTGLPGLILEVDINNGALVITADKIEQKKLTTELDLPKKIKGKRIKESDYTGILRKYFEDCRKSEQPTWSIRY